MITDYKNIPFLSISKEVLKLMNDTLEDEQKGKMLTALYSFIYEGETAHFNSKVETGVWNNLISVIDRKAEGYLKQVDAGKCGSKGAEYGKLGGRPRKKVEIQPNTEFEVRVPAAPADNDKVDEEFDELVTNISKNHLSEESAMVLEKNGCVYRDAFNTDDKNLKLRVVEDTHPGLGIFDKEAIIGELDRYLKTA